MLAAWYPNPVRVECKRQTRERMICKLGKYNTAIPLETAGTAHGFSKGLAIPTPRGPGSSVASPPHRAMLSGTIPSDSKD